MTDELKAGDLVEITVEGVVVCIESYHHGGQRIRIGGHGEPFKLNPDSHGVGIKKISNENDDGGP